MSGPTIQNILAKHGLGSTYERLLRLEERALEEGIELSAEQGALLEKANPCYPERHMESSRPGELLCQDTYLVGNFKGVGKVYLHSLVDTYRSSASGFLYTGRIPEAAVTLLLLFTGSRNAWDVVTIITFARAAPLDEKHE